MEKSTMNNNPAQKCDNNKTLSKKTATERNGQFMFVIIAKLCPIC